MRYSLLYIVLVSLFAFACEDDKVAADCGQPVYLAEQSAIISDPFQITAASITGQCLEIEVGAGGCDGDSWEGTLFVFPDVAESLPPQVGVEFSLKDEELCEAFIRKTFSFDLTGLYDINERVIVRLNGWDEPLLLEKIDFNLAFLTQQWHLISANGGLQGTDMRFQRGDITWTFDETKVIITNKVNDETGIGFKTGTFDYSVYLSESYLDRYELDIDGASLGPITQLNADSLIIDQRPVDGLQLVLVK